MVAKRLGVSLFCLTDHDTFAGSAATEAVFAPNQVLRGVELTCREQKQTVHLLIYDIAAAEPWTELDEILANARQDRLERVHNIVARLEQLHIRLDIDDVLAQSGHTVGRPDVARAMVRAGVVSSFREAFHRYLRDGGPADIPSKAISLGAALEVGRRRGARMSLAHPHTLGKLAAKFVRRYRSCGLEGLEVLYKSYPPEQRTRWLALAEECDLVITGGSDFHGPQATPDVELGVEFPGKLVQPLLEWLGAA